MVPLLDPKLLFDGEQRALGQVFPVHWENGKLSVQFYMKVRAFARSEGRSQCSQFAL